eukprot:GHVP01061919.1.p1 GENE.GHVP01061919.1~~GHVP01061919.1.p1  ORF type:complete len:318 (-),score=39.21 GHVP01061919.1:924-1877(-)
MCCYLYNLNAFPKPSPRSPKPAKHHMMLWRCLRIYFLIVYITPKFHFSKQKQMHPFISCYELLQANLNKTPNIQLSFCPTMCNLNHLPRGSILEVCGEAGSGKSQWLMTQAVDIVLNNLEAYVVFVFTEGVFPASRLHEIAEFRSREIANSQVEWRSSMNRILIATADSVTKFEEVLCHHLPRLLSLNFYVPAVMVDSIAAIYRIFPDTNESHSAFYNMRLKSLWGICSYLKKVGFESNFLTIFLNQVTTNFGDQNSEMSAALGPSWTTFINHRLMLRKNIPGQESSARIVEVEFSPSLPPIQGLFRISQLGIESVL